MVKCEWHFAIVLHNDVIQQCPLAPLIFVYIYQSAASYKYKRSAPNGYHQHDDCCNNKLVNFSSRSPDSSVESKSNHELNSSCNHCIRDLEEIAEWPSMMTNQQCRNI